MVFRCSPQNLVDRALREKALVNFRYVKTLNKWVYFNGKFWEMDATDELYLAFYKVLSKSNMTTDRSDAEIKATINFLSKHPVAKINLDKFDTQVDLINCKNGVVHLDTGTLLTHVFKETFEEPSEEMSEEKSNEKPKKTTKKCYMTRMADVEFDKKEKCPQFEKFINDLFSNYGSESEVVVDYVQKMLGYCLSGKTFDQSFYFFHGIGANGKTTLIEILKSVMGTYAFTFSKSMLIDKNNKINQKYFNELRGLRLAIVNEFEGKDKLNESMIKQLSGGDTLRLDLKDEAIEWKLKAKFIGITNNFPECADGGYSMARRIKIVPFTNTFNEVTADTGILEKLKKEKSGILNWLIEGYRKTLDQSFIVMPSCLRDASDDEMSDTIQKGKSTLEKYIKRRNGHVLTAEQALSFLEALKNGEKATPEELKAKHLTAVTMKKYSNHIIIMDKREYNKIYVGVGLSNDENIEKYFKEIYKNPFDKDYGLRDTHIDTQITYYKKLQDDIANMKPKDISEEISAWNDKAMAYLAELEKHKQKFYP